MISIPNFRLEIKEALLADAKSAALAWEAWDHAQISDAEAYTA